MVASSAYSPMKVHKPKRWEAQLTLKDEANGQTTAQVQTQPPHLIPNCKAGLTKSTQVWLRGTPGSAHETKAVGHLGGSVG